MLNYECSLDWARRGTTQDVMRKIGVIECLGEGLILPGRRIGGISGLWCGFTGLLWVLRWGQWVQIGMKGVCVHGAAFIKV